MYELQSLSVYCLSFFWAADALDCLPFEVVLKLLDVKLIKTNEGKGSGSCVCAASYFPFNVLFHLSLDWVCVWSFENKIYLFVFPSYFYFNVLFHLSESGHPRPLSALARAIDFIHPIYIDFAKNSFITS